MQSERVALYNLVASNQIGNMYSNSNAVVTGEIRCKKLEERIKQRGNLKATGLIKPEGRLQSDRDGLL